MPVKLIAGQPVSRSGPRAVGLVKVVTTVARRALELDAQASQGHAVAASIASLNPADTRSEPTPSPGAWGLVRFLVDIGGCPFGRESRGRNLG